jgi:polyhydroxyalkanoate synthesis regulator phasin
MKKRFKDWLFAKYFSSEKRLIELLVRDNEEMKDIALEQINFIQELQDRVATLEYVNEDLEVKLEYTEDKLQELEYDLEKTQDENQSLEWDIERLEEQVTDLEYELNNREEF